ncbi:hypothetical protein L3Q82_010693 [Scortum barcoo]|uniref:Uncharacterized protein n=1 Tax=Scortum barcoo TaxID=214431 RepID=A0ACB8WCW9_9TELE|nr:hypothetical protein L3Q82_010693 [Scortum barcoo]
MLPTMAGHPGDVTQRLPNGPDSVRISRNKLGYYSGLAVVPNDVVIASGTGASVGKAGEKKGGSRYQESVVEAEWDFGGGEGWGGSGSGAAVMSGCGSSTHVGRRQLDRPSFAY